jgi:hypothetical protein
VAVAVEVAVSTVVAEGVGVLVDVEVAVTDAVAVGVGVGCVIDAPTSNTSVVMPFSFAGRSKDPTLGWSTSVTLATTFGPAQVTAVAGGPGAVQANTTSPSADSAWLHAVTAPFSDRTP